MQSKYEMSPTVWEAFQVIPGGRFRLLWLVVIMAGNLFK